MVSPTATGDELTGSSPFFFRIVPSNNEQATLAAQYAKKNLHAKRVIILSESQDTESEELADDFSQHFKGNGETVVATEEYSSDVLNNLPNTLANTHADLIYFSGNKDDLIALLARLSTAGKLAHVQVLTADPFDELSKLSSKLKEYGHFHFTLLATPEEWHWLGKSPPMATFLNAYQQDFSSKKPGDGTVMLSYDAMLTLLKGCDMVEQNNKRLTPDTLHYALLNITGNQAIQGSTGWISFSESNPSNKLLIIVHINSAGHLIEDQLEGRYR